MDKPQLLGALDKMDAKLDRLDARLDNIDVRLAKYNAELEFHIARTNQIEDALLPITTHVEQLRGASKLIAAIMAVAGLVAGIWQFKK